MLAWLTAARRERGFSRRDRARVSATTGARRKHQPIDQRDRVDGSGLTAGNAGFDPGLSQLVGRRRPEGGRSQQALDEFGLLCQQIGITIEVGDAQRVCVGPLLIAGADYMIKAFRLGWLHRATGQTVAILGFFHGFGRAS
jgi:hypothetical protein